MRRRRAEFGVTLVALLRHVTLGPARLARRAVPWARWPPCALSPISSPRYLPPQAMLRPIPRSASPARTSTACPLLRSPLLRRLTAVATIARTVRRPSILLAPIPRPPAPHSRRHLATETEAPPVRHYGGLKDQDRIFTNAFNQRDYGIKGAMVRLPVRFCALLRLPSPST